MKKQIKVGLLGASGKMGKHLQELIVNHPDYNNDYQLVFACSGPNDPRFALIESYTPDVLIDFSAPPATLKMAKLCAQLKVPMLICTTGFSATQLTQLKKLFRKVPYAIVPNTSLGVYVFRGAIMQAAKQLPSDYAIEIVETHHKDKKDAPSGTAKMLAESICQASGRTHVPIHSLRGGSEVGEHRVIFLGPDEKMECVHKAQDRSLFAHGAIRLARTLCEQRAKPHGVAYTGEDLFARSL